MNLFPQGSGSRPRTACEIAPDGVAAGRSGEPDGSLAAAARVLLPAGAVLPGLKPGNVVDRVAVIAAIRRALEAVGLRPNARGSEVTLVIPDGATRVLLLDFDSLPSKLTEALPIVRFRLKKLLPFEADDAMVSYQVMSNSRNLVRVLAVAMPRDVLSEYETAVREAGFEPGAVLPSTLAALPVVPADTPALLVNASRMGVTTAILRGDLLLLHRTVDLQTGQAAFPANLPPALFEGISGTLPDMGPRAQSAVDPDQGFNAYADRRIAEEVVQGQNSISGLSAARVFGEPARGSVDGERRSEFGQTILVTPASLRDLAGSEAELAFLAASALHDGPAMRPAAGNGSDAHGSDALDGRDLQTRDLAPRDGDFEETLEEEIAQAVSVATAYFEDTLASTPSQVWSAGALPADRLSRLLRRRGLLETVGVEVRELVETAALGASAVSASVPRSALAGVVGALRV